ncbi:MAG: metallophosphoesterase family protein [Planctomycetota bacterium]
MAQRIVILSDTHLSAPGRGAGGAEALRPLWAGADRVVFNGDTVETRARRRAPEAERRLDELRELTAADGVELTLICGNHDPFVGELDWLELGGGAVVLTHGDVLHEAVSPWAEGAADVARDRNAILDGLTGEDRDRAEAELDEELAAAKRAAARKWRRRQMDRYRRARRGGLGRLWHRTRRLWLVFYFWSVMPRRAVRFAREHHPACRFFVFGHIHRPGVWIDRGALPGGGDRVVLNTGSFDVPRRPRAVVIGDGEVSFWKVRFDKKRGHRLAGRPRRRFPLGPAPPKPAPRDGR